MPKNDSPKATEAAKKAAEDAGLDLQAVQPEGKSGNVTKDDVAKAQEKQQEAEETLIYVRVNKEIGGQAFVGPDGHTYDESNPDSLVVTSSYFDEVLANAKNREGEKMFYKGSKL